jgi:hypothetical protein
MSDPVPDGLNPIQYGADVCENSLSWPAQKSNLELIGDCIRAIAKSKRLTDKKAYLYLVRAIKLAREQGIVVDRWFFAEGRYTDVKPVKPDQGIPRWKGETPEQRAAFEAHKKTPEYAESLKLYQDTIARIGGKFGLSATQEPEQ